MIYTPRQILFNDQIKENELMKERRGAIRVLAWEN